MSKGELKKINLEDIYSILHEKEILKSVKFKAHGGSMMPFIKPGDLVSVEPVLNEKLNVGDIVIFHSGELSIIHRMLFQYSRGGSTWLLTKGDSVDSPDAPVHSSRVLGKVVSIERNGRKLDLNSPFFRTLSVFLALISPVSGYYMPVGVKINGLIRRFAARMKQ